MKQTSLDLNGPFLAFETQPTSVTVNNAGVATFTGVCTAYFVSQTPTNVFATNTGIVTHRWYAVGVGALSDGSFRGATLSGTATTTLTVSNVSSPTTSETQFYVAADYLPSAYQSSSPITVGTARSTGNAVNEILNSNTVTLTVNASLSITTQPSSVTVAQGQSTTFSVSASATDSTTVSYQWYLNGNAVSDGTFGGNTISGSTSATLTITTSLSTPAGTSSVYVVVSHPTAGNSPVTSSTTTLTVVLARAIINFEGYSGGTSTSNNFSVNLATTSSYTHTNPTAGFPVLGFYAPEKDVDLELEIYAAKGNDNGGFRGGQGGVSVIRFTARQNEEYIVSPLPQANQGGAVYIYRKARLIAAVGSGGDAGNGGNGGDGGGINVPGANGSGRDAGRGGSVVSAGTLPQTGIFGSAAGQVPIYFGDTRASAPDGGRVLPCARGGYWREQGKQPCEDLGNIQFYWDNGTIFTNSAVISRGHKIGYGIRQTSGAGISGGGNGGQGATGGQGGVNGGGGGGGSGYTDESVTIVSTRQGGNNDIAKVVFKLAS